MKRKLRLSAPQINRLRSLLHMWYTPTELAMEIGVSVQWIRRRAIPAGCPHRIDETNHIWIDGQAFAAWAVRECGRQRQHMEPGQAWCMHCKAAVAMVGVITIKPTNNVLETVQGTCAQCGGRVSRARRKDHD